MVSKKNASSNGGQNSAKKKGKPRGKGKPFEPGNLYRFPKGVSGNPGGRPKLLSEAYRAWLALIDEKTGLTHAELVAQSQGQRAIIAYDTTAAKELRQATEGDLIRDLSKMTDQELDDFIAQRERGTLPGVSGQGTAPENKPAD